MNERNPLDKKRILFVCSGNACRSQIAEGWVHALGDNRVEAFSAGVEAHGMDPLAVAVMAEAGIDISAHHSKDLTTLGAVRFDYVVTLSERAAHYVRMLHVPSPIVALTCDSPTRRSRGKVPSLADYRCIRDEIRNYVFSLLNRTVLSPFRTPIIPVRHANHSRHTHAIV